MIARFYRQPFSNENEPVIVEVYKNSPSPFKRYPAAQLQKKEGNLFFRKGDDLWLIENLEPEEKATEVKFFRYSTSAGKKYTPATFEDNEVYILIYKKSLNSLPSDLIAQIAKIKPLFLNTLSSEMKLTSGSKIASDDILNNKRLLCPATLFSPAHKESPLKTQQERKKAGKKRLGA